MIDDYLFLSQDERKRKDEIFDSFIKLNELNQNVQNERDSFTNFKLELHEHFQEIRRKIDLHRESEQFISKKDQIDNIALEMIVKTKTAERTLTESRLKSLGCRET